MSDIQLTLTADEAGLVIDALEADLDDYLEGPKKRVQRAMVSRRLYSRKRLTVSARSFQR